MPANTRIAALRFVLPFTVSVCIVAVESEIYSVFLVISQRSGSSSRSERGFDDR